MRMALIVVGGHTRNIGKTQLVAEIIRAFPRARWTAMKITQYGHGVCSVNGKHCHCAVDEHRYAILAERDRSNRTDTSRFLVAGAERVYWARTKQGRLAEAMPEIIRRLEGAANVILESNSVLDFLQPDLYLPVLDFSRADFKASARRFLERADACVLRAQEGAKPAWDGVSLEPLAGRPVFLAEPDRLCTPALAAFIRARVGALEAPVAAAG